MLFRSPFIRFSSVTLLRAMTITDTPNAMKQTLGSECWGPTVSAWRKQGFLVSMSCACFQGTISDV